MASKKQVYHPKYGTGVILRSRYNGLELEVKFDSGIFLWLREEELIFKEHELGFSVGDYVRHKKFGKGRVISIEPYEDTAKIMVYFDKLGPKKLILKMAGLERELDGSVDEAKKEVDEKFKSRQMIEAFRLGIVPRDYVNSFTFGRDKEIQEICGWLKNTIEGSFIIVGNYGTGKTHLLNYIYDRALQNNYAVAILELDPAEAPFHRPKRIYGHLINTFRYKSPIDGKIKGYEEFLRECINRGAFKDNAYFKHLIGSDDERIWEWIRGSEAAIRPRKNRKGGYGYDEENENEYDFLPSLYDYSTAANIYSYLLSSLGWASKEIMNLEGLILLFDEAETINLSYYGYQIARGLNFLKSLILLANKKTKLDIDPELTGLEFCKVGIGRDLPFSYRNSTYLKIMFAFTNLDWNYGEYISYFSNQREKKIPEISEIPQLKLEPLTDNVLNHVFEQINIIYETAYDYKIGNGYANKIFRRIAAGDTGRTRTFVKGTVEVFDLLRTKYKV